MSEQNELLEAALKLAESIRPYSLSKEERTLIEVIEQHRLSPVRPWIGRSIQEILDADTGDSSLIHNLANRGRELEAENARWIERTYGAMEKQKPATEQSAKDSASSDARQVHIREVVSVEWEPWTVEMVRNHKNFQQTVDAHNAEMERVTK
jgi:hypothetical protein